MCDPSNDRFASLSKKHGVTEDQRVKLTASLDGGLSGERRRHLPRSFFTKFPDNNCYYLLTGWQSNTHSLPADLRLFNIYQCNQWANGMDGNESEMVWLAGHQVIIGM